MNRQIAHLLALAVFSGGASAEWVEIQKFEDGMRVFVDKATVSRNGDTAKVLHLVRWAEPQVEEGLPPYLSTIVSTSYDCIGKREKYLASTSYAGTMGNGAEVLSDEDEVEGWYSISVASMEEKLWKIACAAKQPLP
ncbi:surface-adhesin E family protein [Propionivibrio sp.]|uniref:surface-adhesin E family protein n=1 Tax=Propionivibrio sp. TaxID=2212460 RepID=UPI003BF255FC